MKSILRSGSTATGVLIALLGSLALEAQAQVRWTADRKASLAWWQINPHLNHLWATTCPEEPSWRPGEGRSGGWSISQALRPPKQGYAAVSDTTIIPLYPRPKVRSICAEAVTATITVDDTTTWRGIRGEVSVKADALVGGETRRDEYARDAVLETRKYPEVKLTIDSVVRVRERADTLFGTAIGVLHLHGVSQPVTAGIRAWPDAGGGLRVLGKFHIPAEDLVPVYNISSFALGLGVGVRVWRDLYMGVDMVVRPEGSEAN